MSCAVDADARRTGRGDDVADRVRNLSEYVGHDVPPSRTVRPPIAAHIRQRVRAGLSMRMPRQYEAQTMSDGPTTAGRPEQREWRLAGVIFFGLLAIALLYAACV